MAKSRDAFRTISEVSDWLDTPAHVLRFWESKFTQIKPVKRAGGRRYYRPQDMALLGGIKTLLHEEGMTIKGAQKLLREKGIKHVSALGPDIGDTSEGLPEDAARDVTPAKTDAIAAAPATPELELIPDAELVEEASPDLEVEVEVEAVDDPWPSDPWSSDADPVAARAIDVEEAEAEVETEVEAPAAIPQPTRSIPALPDAAGAQARPGMLAIITTAQTASVRKNMAAILPLASQLSAVHRRMASAR